MYSPPARFGSRAPDYFPDPGPFLAWVRREIVHGDDERPNQRAFFAEMLFALGGADDVKLLLPLLQTRHPAQSDWVWNAISEICKRTGAQIPARSPERGPPPDPSR